VPAINEISAHGLENYRAFCRGRSIAFETAYGHEFTRRLPAASAVGIGRSECIVAFLASETLPRHYENPHQTPAYLYPLEHGPKSPSFARASVVTTDTATTHFISGTAAIRGHLSIAPNDTAAQTACTVGNLRGISNACGLGEDLGRSTATHRSFKVYLRHATDFAPVADFLGANLLNVRDTVTYLQADICRRELNVEIEAVVTTGAQR
jgi:enamine deaminase RidA (YjgF/YER057c/UK114 family)